MLNSASTNTTIEQIRKLFPQRPPTARENWKAVSHGSVIDELEYKAKDEGSRLCNFRGLLSRNDDDISVSFAVAKGGKTLPGFLPAIGFSASTCQRQILTFYCGAIECATDTPIITAFRAMSRYTQEFNLSEDISTALDWWKEQNQKLPKVINRMKHFNMTRDEVADLLITAMRSEDRTVMPSSRLRKIDKMWSKLRKGDPMNAWTLMQFYAQSQSLQNAGPRQFVTNFNFTQIVLTRIAAAKKGKLSV